MKISLHLAISADGFIAKQDGDSTWVSRADEELFVQRAKEAGCIVVGRTTYKQYEGSIYPIPGVLNIVLTKSHQGVAPTEQVVLARTPDDAIVLARKHGCTSLLIAGGAATAAAFIDQGLVRDIFFSIHPILLEDGIRLFSDISKDTRYRLVGERHLAEGVKEKHYAMI